MSVGDNLTAQYEALKRAFNARQSGLPDRLVVMVYSDDPDVMEAAVKERLAKYGLESEEEARLAHCEIVKTALPWAAGRKIGITARNDPRVMNELRGETSIESEDPSSTGAGFRGAKPKAEHSPDTSLTEDPIG